MVKQWMFANSVHLIDYFNIFCRGELKNIEVQNSPIGHQSKVTSAQLEFTSGDTGIYTGVWNTAGFWSVKITTGAQLLELRPLEQLMQQIYPERKANLIAQDGLSDLKPGLKAQAAEFLRALSFRDHKLPSISDYLVTSDLVAKIYRNN